MNKKIIFLILILLSIFVNVKADVLEIDGKSFSMSSDIIGKGYSYIVSSNTLELNGYNSEHIYTNDELNIIVKGNNYFEDSGNLPLIRAKTITIEVDGILNFTAKASAISSTDLRIKDVKIRGTTTRELIYFTNHLVMENVDIDFDSNAVLIYGGKNISINNSIIKSNNRWGFRYTKNGEALIRNSNIEMKCTAVCLYASASMFFENTNALFYGQTSASSNLELKFDERTTFMISEDGINYQENLEYNGFPYLKTVSNTILDSNNSDLEDDSSNEDSDSTINNDNSKDNNSTSDNDVNQAEDNNSSSGSNSDFSKDETLGDVGDSNNDVVINDVDNNVDINDSFDNSLDNIVTSENNASKDNDTSNNDNSNNDILIENNDNALTDDKLKNDNNLNDDIKKDDNFNNETNDDKNNFNEEKFYTENEYNNDFDNIENPKTFDKIYYFVILLIISLIGIIGLIIVIVRNNNGKA